ncbi:DNA helicase-2 / ATP-dependent DNA helicase PcrA [Lachnospiraceae bacterium G41]|nr:DNA helicase-2 / ATP-dependent DNA helicase PcrA [Lachnospiraceae bacterium G41]
MNLERSLNPEQYEAVMQTEGPLLILAGAGSGKTRVITYRIAHMIDMGISPYNILAITFTNKAAEEMRKRVDDIVGFGADSIWVSTFHSTCARILRRHIDLLGYNSDFSIYDTDDSKKVMNDLLKKHGLNPKEYPPKMILSTISSNKNEMVTPEEYESFAKEDYEKKVSFLYREYEKVLFDNNALDFDDLLLLTVELFKKNKDVLENYRNRFKYILVDEYQDTNSVQFAFIKLLADKYKNLCVVGDDDQSIYRFRGANIRNILDFEKNYPTCKVVKLEQNYRSTENILNAANAVIAHNIGRKEKTLWSARGDGSKIHFRQFPSSKDEAMFVANDIYTKVRRRDALRNDIAILYRTNQQSRELEEVMLRENIPYTIVGGTNFYSRREIKDILAYLKTIANGNDNLNVERIVNVPKRGIGETSLGKARMYAENNEISLFEALLHADRIPSIGKAADKMKDFASDIIVFRERINEGEFDDIPEIISELIDKIKYEDYIKENEDKDDANDRLANIDELISKAAYFEEKYLAENPDAEKGPTLQEFLNDVSLVADIDNADTSLDRILMMTLHSAKGLEFSHVYIVGMEDGLFPGERSITSYNSEDIEEERRLAYVGITRAKDDLTLTAAQSRMARGQWQNYPISRFVREIPSELLDSDTKFKKSTAEEIPMQHSKYASTGIYGGYLRNSSNGASKSIFGGVPYASTGLLSNGKPKATAKVNITHKTNNETFNPSARDADLVDIKSSSDTARVSTNYKTATVKATAKPLGFTKGSDLKSNINYKVGDRVNHIKFGEGTVKEIDSSGVNTYVKIEFDQYGQRILDSRFTKLTVI